MPFRQRQPMAVASMGGPGQGPHGFGGAGPRGFGGPGPQGFARPGYPMQQMGPMIPAVGGYSYNSAENSMMGPHGMPVGYNQGMAHMQPGMTPYMQPGMMPYAQPGMTPFSQPGMTPFSQPGMQPAAAWQENQNAAEASGLQGATVTVFVGNIVETVTDEMIKYMLGKCGTVIEWKRAVGASGTPATFGFCGYADPEEALRAIRVLHDRPFAGQKLVVKADAKTKVRLQDYKAGRKVDKYADEESREKDRIARRCIETFSKAREPALMKRTEGDVKAQAHLKKINGKIANDNKPKKTLDDLNLEEDTKNLIAREMEKFKTTVGKWDKEQERQKREVLEFRRRREEREKRHARADKPYERSRSREREHKESEREKRSRDKEDKLKRMKEIERELEQEEMLERQKREQLLVQERDEAAYQEDLTRQAVLSLLEQDHASNPTITGVLKDLLISTYLIPNK